MKRLAHVIVASLIALTAHVYAADTLSINLEDVSYYTSNLPFKDLMFQSLKNGKYRYDGTGATNCKVQPEDADGYPLSLDTADNCLYNYELVPGVQYPIGHYVFIYDGTGTFALGGDVVNLKVVSPGRFEFDVATAKHGIWISILSTSADHVRNFHVFLASDEATYQTQPFRQAFLDLLSPFGIIRFMNWTRVTQRQVFAIVDKFTQPDSNTIVLNPPFPNFSATASGPYVVATVHVPNGNQWPRVFVKSYDGTTGTIHLASPVPLGATKAYFQIFPNRTWAQRTPLSNQHQQDASGVAYEYMIQLANTANKDIWLNIPTAADDDFITQLATLLKNKLNPNLKIYVEYSNETWNYEFPGYDYSEAMQKVLGLVGSTVIVPADAWHPYRALWIFHLFNQVFGEQDLRADRTASRIVRILTSQTAWLARMDDVLYWTNPGGAAPTYSHHAFEYADAVAVTSYWGFPAGFNAATLPANNLNQMLTQLIALQKQAIDQAAAPTDPNGNNYLYVYAQQARALGLKLIGYEGGEGFVPNQYSTDQYTVSVIINLLDTMNHDSRMADVYVESLTKWQWLSQQFPGTIGNWAQFTDMGGCSQYGCWGLLDGVMQDPSTAPRYQGILEFLKSNANSPPTF